jgi:ribose transport system permease protein
MTEKFIKPNENNFLTKAAGQYRKLGKNTGMFFVTLIIFILFSLSSEAFFTVYNITNILKNSSILMVAAIGTTMAILSGHNDLSIGSVMSMSGAIAAVLMRSGVHFAAALLVAITLSTLCGLINGLLIAYIKADFWIVTFSMLSIAQGIALVLTEGKTVSGFPDAFRYISKGKILGINFLIFLTVVLAAVMIFVLRKTKFGYDVYAIGDSEACSILSGVNVKRGKLIVFTLGGFFAGIAGIMLTAKSNSAVPTGGAGFEFDAIAAVLIGGTVIGGGKGGYAGTIIGAFLINMIRNGLSMMGVSSLLQYVLIGVIILMVIIYDVTKTRIRSTRENRRRYLDV